MNKNQTVNLLIIEDCKITSHAYKTIFETIPNCSFNMKIAHNCDEAVKLIQTKKNTLIILDLQLPVSKNEKYVSGEDLALLIRETKKEAKIIILTNVSNPLRINSIIKEINPEGFIIKTETSPENLKHAVNLILSGNNYYSNTIENGIKTKFNGLVLDDFDRKILYRLSMGVKIKDICKFVALSHRAIEVRISKLKTVLLNTDNTDSNLIKEAKKLGII